MDWIDLLKNLGGLLLSGGIGGIVGWKTMRKQNEALAQHAQHDADEAEVKRLHMQINHQQESLDVYIKLERDSAERIAEQNKALNEKTAQIRQLTADVIASERKANEINDRLTREQEKTAALERENGDMREENAYLRQWVCEKAECNNGIPPRERLKGKRFDHTRLRYARETMRKYCDTAKEIINVNINENAK